MKSGFVAIIGKPNVGKSTLLNHFIGQEIAIVTPKPQTTRQKIIGICNKDNAQVVFLDTPGFHASKKMINRVMIEHIEHAIKKADVVVLVVEPGKRPDGVDLEIFSRIKTAKVILVINKIDTVLTPWGEVVDKYWDAFDKTPTVAISASRGDGCETLLNKIIEFLPDGEPFYPSDQPTAHPVRFLAAEIVREQAMIHLRQELPYSLAVEVEEFKEGKTLTKILASIIVEKDSQKGIVIGAGGQMIKKIGSLARAKIETLVGTKVYLELNVKVVEDWTKDMKELQRFGYK